MDVFLIPIGADRYDLYCEVEDGEPEAPVEQPKGRWKRLAPRALSRRLMHRFRLMLAEAERERRHGRVERPQGWLGRIRARTMRWVAESIAEQRLLWHLRRQQSACLVHPDDLDTDSARDVLRRHLARDFDKHRFWLTIDSLAMVASLLLVLIPGPNILGYYFAFRVVGHFLSLRGARNGLDGVEWKYKPSSGLSQLRGVLDLSRDERDARVGDIARALGLEYMEHFFARAAIKE